MQTPKPLYYSTLVKREEKTRTYILHMMYVNIYYISMKSLIMKLRFLFSFV